MPTHYKQNASTLTLYCVLQPKASKDEFAGLQAEKLKIRIKAPPIDGKANSYLIKFLSKEFNVAQKNITILSGQLSRHKTVAIAYPQHIPEGALIYKHL